MNAHSRQEVLRQRKRRIQYRLRERQWSAQEEPMLRGRNILYDVADRAKELAADLEDIADG